MTDDNLQIRIATTDDMEEVMRLAIAASEDNSFIPASPALLAREIWPALCQDHGLCAVIGPPGGAIEGLVLLRVGAMWYSEQTVVEEKAVFVYPEFRAAKGGRARRLCEYSKHVAQELGLPLLIGILSNERTAAKVKLYERTFGPPSGAFWLVGATTGGHKVTES
jgi:N-acetylglutamate synthase-like GNAT family acetyltransferase